MKKKLGIFAMMMMFGLAACGGGGSETTGDREENVPTKKVEATMAPEDTVTEAPNATEAPTATLEPTATPEPTEAPEPDYEAMARNIEAKLTIYFDAWKNGDIETIISMTKPEDELYEYLTILKEYENIERLLQMVYADIIFQDYSEALADRVKYSMDDSSFFVTNEVAMPYANLIADRIPSTLYQPGDIIEEGFRPADDEEALEIISKLVKDLPLEARNIKISMPDAEGNFYVLEGERYFDFFANELNTYELDEEYLLSYVEALFDPLGDKIVAAEDSVYTDYNAEHWPKIIELFLHKDFDGMFEYYTVLFDGLDLRTYEFALYDENKELLLTDAQLAFLNDFVDNIEVFHRDIARVGNKEQLDTIYYICPAVDSLDEEVQAWYTENDIKEVTYESFSRFPSDAITRMTDLYMSAATDAKRIIKE